MNSFRRRRSIVFHLLFSYDAKKLLERENDEAMASSTKVTAVGGHGATLSLGVMRRLLSANTPNGFLEDMAFPFRPGVGK